MSDSKRASVDDHIKAKQLKGAGVVIAGAIVTLLVLLSFFYWLVFVKGYAVQIAPQEARQQASVRVLNGAGVVSEHSLYSLFGGELTVEISAPTYISETLTINADSPSTLSVTLQPQPALIHARLADDVEASWFIDEQRIAVGNHLQHELAAGDYVLRVDSPFHQSWQQSLSLARGEEVELTPALTLIEGQLSVSSQVTDASVRIDGGEPQPLPLSINLAGGRHQLQVTAAGYQTIDDSIEISNNQPSVSRAYRLQPLQSQLQISATPADGVLTIDGRSQQLGNLSIAANRAHQVRYQRDGYASQEQSLTPRVGEQQKLHFELVATYGDVRVQSNLPGQLQVNGQVQGETPQQLRLQTVEQRLTLTKPGYRTVTRQIQPRQDRVTQVQMELLTEFDARRAEGRPLFVSTLGIEMARFQPSAYVMGSPANERDRKRDEYQLRVDFSRPIWVSRHEITEAQYHAFTQQGGTSSLPVSQVSWLEAVQYCNWLSEQEGLPLFYRIQGQQVVGVNAEARGYRLLTEAEWEWLAKQAGRSAATTFIWGNGERIPNHSGNFADQSLQGKQTFFLKDYNDGFTGKAPVGSFKADRVGLFDLAGNVSEWVHDRYTTNPPDTSVTHTDYLGPTVGQQHVVKGANYESGRLQELRNAAKIVGDGAAATIGFRIARYD
ncbi:SUMF1/EgtB/PvdO family nonheme iron enzyme [Idiomarina xiamenensis]|uniref:PEGA domain-containing protein n=1 Tax=Idiomarina xiamenensis 10-D-4 TaxID=740709 RepID=K2KSQ6_9GAMM|nr:SUMF1/EgtB/PvdO family nonheme iron enzyme [Idiomarina xiamenensis]EKE80635.1 hypothetical protein A10D4_11771 [Idiomarina xiamenensis 10-D-4]